MLIRYLDRMLVRRSNVKSGDVGTYFDAEKAMKLRDLRSQEWKELLVVWRKDQLELYEDYVSQCVFTCIILPITRSPVNPW